MKRFLFIGLMLMGIVTHAHQPDLSTSLLSTTAEGHHILQVTSSLTAFEGQIEYIYSKGSYKTPEEFQELVAKYFKENVLFIVNDDTLEFAKPVVILGHETKLVVEVLNIPKNIKSFYYKNTMFKDMPKNQMALMILSDGFPKEQLVLNNENNQTVQQVLKENKWESLTEKKLVSDSFINEKVVLFLLLISAVVVLVLYYKFRKRKGAVVSN